MDKKTPETITTMSSTEATGYEDELLKLECHFTWGLKSEELDLTNLLNRLEDHVSFTLGGEEGLAQTYNSLGFVKYLLGSPQDALTFLLKCVDITKNCWKDDCDKWLVVPYGNLAWLQYHMKCFSECETYLEMIRNIAQKFPNPALGLHHEVLGEKAWAYFKFSRKYYSQAKECFEKALELEPMNAQWNCGYAFVLHRIETQQYRVTDSMKQSTIEQLRRAIETNSDNDELKALLAVKLAQSNKYDEGEALVEEALESSPDVPNVIRYVGKFFRTYGFVERSIALLKRALEKSPTSAFIYHQLALCYKKKIFDLQQERKQTHANIGAEVKRLRSQCIYHLDKATELKPGFIAALTELANQYSEDRKIDCAEKLFQQTLEIAKERNDGIQQVYFSYGQFQQYKRKSLPDAITYYMECLSIDGDTMFGQKSAKCLTKINDVSSSKCPGSETAQRRDQRNAKP